MDSVQHDMCLRRQTESHAGQFCELSTHLCLKVWCLLLTVKVLAQRHFGIEDTVSRLPQMAALLTCRSWGASARIVASIRSWATFHVISNSLRLLQTKFSTFPFRYASTRHCFVTINIFAASLDLAKNMILMPCSKFLSHVFRQGRKTHTHKQA